MVKVLGIGIGTMDIYRQYGMMYPGGNEYNIAWHIKELGGESGFMGVFGDDQAGKLLYQVLKEKGADLSHSHHETGPSGYAIIDLKDGDRVFADWNKRGVTDLYPFDLTEDELRYAGTFDVVCASHNARLSRENIYKLKKAGARICYDFCEFFDDEEVEELSPVLDFGFFSGSHLGGKDKVEKLLRQAAKFGCRLPIATMGADGAMAFDGSRIYTAPSAPVRAVDTMGAGDSFISAFLWNYLLRETDESLMIKDNISDSLEAAAAYAAKAVTVSGSLGVGFQINMDMLPQLFHLN